MTKMAIIADDLTGACDSGVQLAKYGLQTSVFFNYKNDAFSEKQVVIVDTDSRSLPGQAAYEKARDVVAALKLTREHVVYKKIDSTMRGNIGMEINGAYDAYRPDLVIIAPGHPEKGRKVINGHHYLNGVPLNETEVAQDPKTPVKTSYIPELIEEQTRKVVGTLNSLELHQGYEVVKEKVKSYLSEEINYLVCDSATKEDLILLTSHMKKLDKSILWVGSAGLIQCLPECYGFKQKQEVAVIQTSDRPVLLVIGSVSDIGRRQLDQLLKQKRVEGLELNSALIVQENEQRKAELERVYQEAHKHLSNGIHVALYTSRNPQATQEAGERFGYSAIQVSNTISIAIGELAASIVDDNEVNRLFLTGGDTANQVFRNLKVEEFRLIEEIEPGLPLGKCLDKKNFYIVTKAGSFGNDDTMVNSIRKLQGESEI